MSFPIFLAIFLGGFRFQTHGRIISSFLPPVTCDPRHHSTPWPTPVPWSPSRGNSRCSTWNDRSCWGCPWTWQRFRRKKPAAFSKKKQLRHAFPWILNLQFTMKLLFVGTQQKAWFCHTTFLLRGNLTVPYGSQNLCESEKFPWSLVSLILPLDSSVRDAAAAL